MTNFRVESVSTECPYCGESIELLVDCSEYEQDYIEDCQVCCRPINIHVVIDDEGAPSLTLSHQDES